MANFAVGRIFIPKRVLPFKVYFKCKFENLHISTKYYENNNIESYKYSRIQIKLKEVNTMKDTLLI